MNAKNTLTSRSFLLIFFLALCFVIAFAGHVATGHSVHSWYHTLDKPSWNPPSWVFAPAWTILYLMIAAAGWLISLAKPSKTRTKVLAFYFIQLAANGLWSFSFFYFQSPGLGLVNIVFLEIFIGLTLSGAWSINKKATWLLVPYFLWVFYATTLNAAIFWLNRAQS